MAKRKNAVVRYFTPFGVRQVCDLTMFLGFVMLIVGMCVYKTTPAVLIVGFVLVIAGTAMAIFRAARIMLSGINRRSPEYKSSLVNVIMMSAICILAIIGMIFTILNG